MAQVSVYPDNGQSNAWVTTLIAPQEFHYGTYNSCSYSDGSVNGREGGLRFSAVTIPKDSTVISAQIDFRSYVERTLDMVIRIRAEAVDDSIPFRVSNNDATNFAAFNARPRTTAYYDWTAPAFGVDLTPVSLVNTVNMAPVIQEVISRSGWKAGNALTLFFWGQSSTQTTISRYFYGFSSTSFAQFAPKLTIYYTPPALNYGIKVSRDGYSALILADSPTNIKKFAMISNINMLKIKLAAKISLGTTTTTIAHGLSYRPICWVFENSGGSVTPVYYNTSGTYFYVDNTNLVIRNVSSTREFIYYIFYDPV